MHKHRLSCDCPECEALNRRLDLIVVSGVVVVFLIGLTHLWQQLVLAITGGM